MRPSSAHRRRLPIRTWRTAVSPAKSAVESAANTEPTAHPLVWQSENPCCSPSSTPGVASACRAKAAPKTGRRARRAAAHLRGVPRHRRWRCQDRRENRRDQYQPEVRGVVLPANVEVRQPKQQQETEQWQCQDNGGQSEARAAPARGLSHLGPSAQLGTGGFRRRRLTLLRRRTPPV